MTKRGKVITGSVTAAIAAILFMLKTSANDKCYTNQNGVRSKLDPPGLVRGMDPHGVCGVGLDGVCYGLFGQCPIAGPEFKPQRPGPGAGALVQLWWAWYWTDPNAAHHRCYALHPGMKLPPAPPTDDQVNDCTTADAGCLPMTGAASGTFNPIISSCGGVPTPSPGPTMQPTGATTPCWGTSQGCVTPVRTPTAGCPVCPTCPPAVQTPPRTVTFGGQRTPTPLPGPCVIHCPPGQPCGATGCANVCTGQVGVPCP